MLSSSWRIVSNLYLRATEELRLNPDQWTAYESEGHCVVLAGPGSGKTKTLTIKLARILAEDVREPHGVACITYNNQCAKELEQRLDALGVEPGDRVFIGTVHSFSLTQIILPYAKSARLGLPDEFRVATQNEQKGALEHAYDRVIGRGENPHQSWRLTMDRYRRSHLDRSTAAWRESDPKCARLVTVYESELRKRGLIDFDDMPLLSLQALRENKWLQKAIAAKYPVLIIDEYQDLGYALHRMVMGLCFSTGIRLFAVGDVDQSIYGFTGANPQLLQQLSERKDVETVRLRLNYRCGAKIVSASKYALGEDRGYEAPENAPDGTIFFHPLEEQYEQQAAHLFRTVLPAAFDRMPDLTLDKIAILYPAAWIGDAVADAAQEHSFEVIRTDGNAVYPRSSRLMRWLEQCALWCCNGWRTGIPRLSKLVAEGSRILSEVLVSDNDKFSFQRGLLTLLWARRDSTLSLHRWLVDLREELLIHLLTVSRTLRDERDILNAFVERTGLGKDCEDLTLGGFCGHGEGNNRINLSTLHSSKGREFALVILFGIDADIIPRKKASEREQLEARRLFYVGFTRAGNEIHITYSKLSPSWFVTELQYRLESEQKG